MDLRNFSLSKKDEIDSEAIRERNLDRLKLLMKYEEGKKYEKDKTYLKYDEKEEE